MLATRLVQQAVIRAEHVYAPSLREASCHPMPLWLMSMRADLATKLTRSVYHGSQKPRAGGRVLRLRDRHRVGDRLLGRRPGAVEPAQEEAHRGGAGRPQCQACRVGGRPGAAFHGGHLEPVSALFPGCRALCTGFAVNVTP